MVAEVGVGGETHFGPVGLPGTDIELEQSGIGTVFGVGMQTGFAKNNVADDIGINAVENTVLVGKAGNLSRSKLGLRLGGRGWRWSGFFGWCWPRGGCGGGGIHR